MNEWNAIALQVTPGMTFSAFLLQQMPQYVYLNPATVSSSCPGVQMKLRWRPDDGVERTASALSTIVMPVVEPICNETKTVVEDGRAHALAYNPSGVAVGQCAYFKIRLNPEDFPDRRIVWESSGGIEFVGGNTGREVCVRGVSVGETELTVRIGDVAHDLPTFTLHVVNGRSYGIKAMVVGDNERYAQSESNIRQMVDVANDIYRQIGMSFYLDSIAYTNIPNAYHLADDDNDTSTRWKFDQLVDLMSGTGMIECYFVGDFVDVAGKVTRTLGSTTPHGIVLAGVARGATLAHEIGHLCGMRDIYVSNRGKRDVLQILDVANEFLSCSKAVDDWSSGCDGCGRGGVRYYAPGTDMGHVINRLLMCGEGGDAGDVCYDITAGDVYGVWYEYDGDTRVWHEDDAPMGFFDARFREPICR